MFRIDSQIENGFNKEIFILADKNLGEDESNVDVSSPRDTNSPIVSRSNGVSQLRRHFNGLSNLQFGVVPKQQKDSEREKLLGIGAQQAQSQTQPPLPPAREKTTSKWFRQDTDSKKATIAAEKEEKKRIKAAAKNAASGKVANVKSLSNFKHSDKSLVPIFLEQCVQFIEREGVDSEGIYRVPGNRTNVDLLYQQFDEEDNVDIEKLDIPVNAVATALKDFFSKHLPPLFDPDMMNELEEIAGSRGGLVSANPMNMEVKTDRSCRLMALRTLLNKLPPANFAILKFIFQHFVR